MKSSSANGFAAKVTEIDESGFHLQVGNEILHLPFAEFPWFKTASEAAIRGVQMHTEQHLAWPELDVDLEVDAIRHPERFPIVFEPEPAKG